MNTVTANNKKYIAYNTLYAQGQELKKELRTLQARIEEQQGEQRELVAAKVQNLAGIGQRVFRKCVPDYYAVPDHKAKEILGELGWIYSLGKFQELNGYSVKFENGSVERKYLHMSDRDFAKLIRQKVRAWKDAQNAEKQKAEVAEAEAARKAVEKAQQALLQAEKAAEAVTAAELKREAKLQAKADARAKHEAELKS